MSASPLRCPSCGASDPNLLGKLPDSKWFAGMPLTDPILGGHLYRCEQCLLKFRFPLETPTTYQTLYDNAKTNVWSADTERPDWDLITAQVNTLKPEGGRILDFGCYTGGLLSRMGARYERFGIELNREAAHAAQQTTGARVWPTIKEIPANLKFDIIVIADVVEHIPNPNALFELLEPRLAERGVVIVATGDADTPLWNRFGANWWYCFYPEHIAFISMGWAQRVPPPKRMVNH